MNVRLIGYFAPDRKARKAPKGRQLDRQLFISDGLCRERVVTRVVSTLNQPFQPRDITGMVDLFTTVINAVEAKVPPQAPILHLQSVVPQSIVLRQCLFERVENNDELLLFFFPRCFRGWLFLVPVKHNPKGSHDAIVTQHFIGAQRR